MMLSDRRPILLANARIVDPSRDLDIVGDLLIAEGTIREAKKGIGAAGVPEGTDVIDCRGKLVAPGLIDMRAFIGEPGEASRETLASASQAAAAGGVTTIICQPDTSPAIDNPATVDFVLRRARDNAIVHVHPMAAITKGLEGKEMTEIGLLKAAGAVAFTDGAKSVINAQVMRRVLTYAGDFDAMIVHHTEDPNLIGDGVMNEGEFAARLGLLGIPKAAETVMLERDIRLVALAGGRYHAASVTCADTLEVLRRAKDAGLNVTASASINHVTLNENDIGPYRTFLKLAPPLRAEDDRKALVVVDPVARVDDLALRTGADAAAERRLRQPGTDRRGDLLDRHRSRELAPRAVGQLNRDHELTPAMKKRGPAALFHIRQDGMRRRAASYTLRSTVVGVRGVITDMPFSLL